MNAAGHGEGLGEAFDGGGPRELVEAVRRDAGGGGLGAEVLRAEHSVGPQRFSTWCVSAMRDSW